MAEFYGTKYKCRLCNETFIDGGTSNKDIVREVMVSVVLNIPSKHHQAPTMTTSHCCSDGSMGVADFLGFEYQSDDKKSKRPDYC